MKLYIKTFGCQMNAYDSARMQDALSLLGYQKTEKPSEADVILLNTCHIREKASEKLFSEMEEVILKISAEIRSGCADARPLKYNGKDPCAWCEARSVCRYVDKPNGK